MQKRKKNTKASSKGKNVKTKISFDMKKLLLIVVSLIIIILSILLLIHGINKNSKNEVLQNNSDDYSAVYDDILIDDFRVSDQLMYSDNDLTTYMAYVTNEGKLTKKK